MRKLFYFIAAIVIALSAFTISSCDILENLIPQNPGIENPDDPDNPDDSDDPDDPDNPDNPDNPVTMNIEGDWFLVHREGWRTQDGTRHDLNETFEYDRPVVGTHHRCFIPTGNNRYSQVWYYWNELHGTGRWVKHVMTSMDVLIEGNSIILAESGNISSYIEHLDEDRMVLHISHDQADITEEYIKKPELPIIPVAEAIDTEEGKIVRVKGVCKSIANTKYGNWYLEDESGEIYIYGTLDGDFNEKQFESLNISTGNIVTVEGYRKNYNDLRELVNVSVIDVDRTWSFALSDRIVKFPYNESTYEVRVETNTGTVEFEIPEDSQSWLSVSKIDTSLPTKSYPVYKTTFSIAVLENSGMAARNTYVTFKTPGYSEDCRITQAADITDTNVGEFLSMPVDPNKRYRIKGRVKSIVNSVYGNFYLATGADSVYVYGLTSRPQTTNDKSFASLGLKVDDVVTIVGPRGEYNGIAQMYEAYYESSRSYQVMSIQEALAAGVNNRYYYQITGRVSNINNAEYGNFDLTDDEGNSIYVYGLMPNPLFERTYTDTGWIEKYVSLKLFDTLGINEGDIITVNGSYTTYNNKPQLAGAYLISKQ